MSSRPARTRKPRRLWVLAPVLALPLVGLTSVTDTTAGAAPAAAATDPAPEGAVAAPVADETASSAIRLRNLTLDTTDGVPPPPTMAAKDSSGDQLRLVQFAGPIKPRWYAALAARSRVVTYLPDNAYLVWTSAAEADALVEKAETDPALLYSGPFDPYYRLAPALMGKEAPAGDLVDVTVQVVDNQAGAAALDRLVQDRTVLATPYDLAGLRTVSVRIPADRLEAVASLAPVVDVEPYVAPERNDEVQDQLLAGNVSTVGGKTTATAPGYLAWLDARGFPHDASQYVKAFVVDDGIDDGDTTPLHPDFYVGGNSANASRLTDNEDCTTDPLANGVGGHGNLNAGIVGGYHSGSTATDVDAKGYSYGLGVSPFGRLGGIKIFRNAGSYDVSACGGNDAGVVAKAYAAGAGFTTNSWGAAVGGAYDASARAYDALVRDASATTAGNQEMLHVFSAGNDGAGGNTIGSPGTAKNVLTIGATENVRDEGTLDGCGVSTGDSDSDIAVFSSRGPTDDQRVKPDLVAAGTHVQGPASQDPGYNGTGVCGASGGTAAARFYPAGQTLWTWSSGTSHSTPAVAGAVQLTQNYYGRVLDAGHTASPAMLKALLSNTPRYLNGVGTGGTLPSNNQGYGVPDLGALFSDPTHRVLVDQTHLFTASGQSFVRAGNINDAAKPVRVTLAWTDAPGATVGNAYVNNLDLVVTAGGKSYRGNVFSGGLSTTGGSADARNNVENVFLPAGTTGPISVQVLATNIAGDGVPATGGALDQDFALTVANMNVAPTAVAGAGGVTYQDSDFDGDSVVQPGEVLNVAASVQSVGDLPLSAGSGSLSVVSGPASVLQGSSAYPAIPSGAAASGTTAYQVRIDPAATCGAPVVLQHVYTAGGGQTVTEQVTVPLGAPPATASYTSTDVPKAIPDNNPAGVTSTLTVPAGSGTVHRLRVTLNVTHTWVGDLSATLTTPSGTALTLFSRIGGNGNSGDNLVGTVFADDAAATPGAGGAPYTGSYKPVTAFSTVDGQTAAGTWTLKLSDAAPPDAGTLTSWGITNTPDPTPVCAAARPSVRIATPVPAAEGTSLQVPVTLLSPDGSSHSVTFTPSPGTATAADFDPAPVTVTWASGDPATKNVSIPLTLDGIAEPEETFSIGATASDVPVSAPVTGRITSVPPSVSVADPASATEGSPLSFPVTLTGRATGATYTVDVKTADGTAGAGDYTPVSTTLTWAPGDAATKTVTVATTQDSADEPDESLTVNLSAPAGGGEPPVIGRGTATGTVLDDDVPGTTPPSPPAPPAPPAAAPVVTVKKAKVTEGDKGSRALVFQVSLSKASASPVSFAWATKDLTAQQGSDYKKASGTLTVPAGATSATITVKVKGDQRAEPNEKLALVLSGILNATFGGSTSVKGKIVDDD